MTLEPAPVVRLRSPADLLSALPHLLGFHPEESLVVVCLKGPRRRQGLTMRIDLPDADDEAEIALELAERVAYENADAVAMVCYTAAPDAGGTLPRAELIETLGDLLGDLGVEVQDAFLTRGTRWWSYTCANGRCCPRTGTELPVRPSSAGDLLAVEAVWRGSATLPDRAALVASIEPTSPGAVTRADDAGLRGGSEAPAGAVEVAGRLLRRYREGGPGLSPAEATLLSAGLRDVRVRDEIATWGLEPDPEVLLALLTDLARATPDEYAAPTCTLLAWVAYLDGNGALANVALERALRAEEDYSMALLLADALAAQMPPSAMRRVTAAAGRDLNGSPVRRQQPRRRSRRGRRTRRGGKAGG
jgi:hypothetical protein